MIASTLYEVDPSIFSERFVKKENFTEIWELAKSCRLSSLNNRLICWRIFLGIFKESENVHDWVNSLEKLRNEYRDIKQRVYAYDPDLKEKLSSSENVIKLKPNVEILVEILKIWLEVNNLSRNYSERVEGTQIEDEIIDILCIVVHVVNAEKFADEKPGEAEDLLRILNSPSQIASDSYFIFSEIMKLNYLSLNLQSAPIKKLLDKSIISLKCERIYHYYLKSLDPELYNLLVSNSIPTEKNLSRWIFSIMTSDFSPSTVIVLWDLLFSLEHHERPSLPQSKIQDNKELIMIDFLCVSMLLNIRDLLMGEHLHGINLHLSAYPPVTDVEILTKTAIKSLEFFVRHTTIKFVLPDCSEKKHKKNMKDIFKKVKGGLKRLSFGGLINKFKSKKVDKFSNIRLDPISRSSEDPETETPIEILDSTLVILKNFIESETFDKNSLDTAIDNLKTLKSICP